MPKRAAGVRARRARPTGAVLTNQDLELARRDALLQLRIGRSAHFLAVGVSAVLGLDAILILFFFSPLPSIVRGAAALPLLGASVFLLLPILASLALAVVGLLVKWEEFRLWPWERHFAVTVLAVALGALTTLLYVSDVAGLPVLGALPIYPTLLVGSLGTISLAMVGLGLTWQPWGGRHWASAACALIPFATLLLVYDAPSQAGSGTEPLATSLLLSAVLYQMSGSFLHLVSSGTPVHRQAVVLAGQDRIGQLAEEVRQKEEALRFRELSVLHREAEAETAEAAAQAAQQIAASSEERLHAADADLRARSEAVAARERDLAGRSAELDGQAGLVAERERAATVKSANLDKTGAALNERAVELTRRAGELAQKDVELSQRQQAVERKLKELPEAQRRLELREKQIEEKTNELLRREGEVAAREGSPNAAAARTGRGAADPEPDLAAREARARHLKTLLDEQAATMAQRAQELAAQSHALESDQRALADRQAQLAAREATLAQRTSDLDERLRSTGEGQKQVEATLADYRGRMEGLARQQSEVARLKVDVERTLKEVSGRERAVSEKEAKVVGAGKALEARESVVLGRERAAEAREAEISLRRQEIALGGVAGSGSGEARSGSGSIAGAARPRNAVAAQTVPDSLATAPGRKYADRLPSGTPRLDDLLLGGLPPRSHVALVGEAFVGKEVALYAFLAEGLKRSEPVVLVTATRTPEEISEKLGLLLPQFREFEQMGKVTWIDASGSGAAGKANRRVVRGADDLQGILSSLVKASTDLGESRFRVGFLGLSTSIAQGGERAGFSFLQNLVGILKPREALAMYALEAGSLAESQVESLLSRMDGAILFRQERDRTFLSVKGFDDVETREWIECRATSRALVIGSFALERIR